MPSKLNFATLRPVMRSRYRILEKRQAHFITGTIVVPGEARVGGIAGALALFLGA